MKPNIHPNLTPIGMGELRPFLRYARRISVTPDYGYNNIVCYDARVIYITGGRCEIRIDGHCYPLDAGSLVAWQAGQRYSFENIVESPLEIIMLNLDYAADAISPALLIPDRPDDFDAGRLRGVYALCENADYNGVLYDTPAFYAEPYMHELLCEYSTRRIYSDTAARGLLTLLLSKLCRRLRSSPARSEAKAEELIAYIHAHLNEELTYASLGQLFSYHPGHINRIVTRITGMPFHRYLVQLRIERACQLLCGEGRSVAETAALCGFSDAMSFAKCFRRVTGMTPTEARKRGL